MRRPRPPTPSTPISLPAKVFAWSAQPIPNNARTLPGTPQMTTMEVRQGAAPALCLLRLHAGRHHLQLTASMLHVPGCATTRQPPARLVCAIGHRPARRQRTIAPPSRATHSSAAPPTSKASLAPTSHPASRHAGHPPAPHAVRAQAAANRNPPPPRGRCSRAPRDIAPAPCRHRSGSQNHCLSPPPSPPPTGTLSVASPPVLRDIRWSPPTAAGEGGRAQRRPRAESP